MIAVCVAGNHVAEVFKHFAEGPACRTCVLRAATITALYSIDGKTYTERLKSPLPKKAEPIQMPRKKRSA
jgi:hypothetical protein